MQLLTNSNVLIVNYGNGNDSWFAIISFAIRLAKAIQRADKYQTSCMIIDELVICAPPVLIINIIIITLSNIVTIPFSNPTFYAFNERCYDIKTGMSKRILVDDAVNISDFDEENNNGSTPRW